MGVFLLVRGGCSKGSGTAAGDDAGGIMLVGGYWFLLLLLLEGIYNGGRGRSTYFQNVGLNAMARAETGREV